MDPMVEEEARRMIDPRKAHLHETPTRDVVTELARKASELARKEVALARSEVKEDLRSEIRMASGLGIAGVCALVGLNMLLVALVLGLTEAGLLDGWVWALVVAGVVLAAGAIVGLVGWKKRVRVPLETTRRSVEENVRWVKERMT